MNGKKNRLNRTDIDLFFLALPAVLLLLIFNYLPMIGIIIPFKDVQLGNDIFSSKWIGLKNFKFLFSSPDAFIITRNTIGYNLIFIIVGTFVSVSFALMLYELGRKSVKVYQTVMFIPYFFSWIVVSLVFSGLLDMRYGILNVFLEHFGFESIAWYNKPIYWPYIIVFTAVWKGTGYSTLIYYTGLVGINTELFEAASIDGASKLKIIKNISLPALKPLIIMLTLFSIGKIFYSDFGLFYHLPKNSKILYEVTQTIDIYVYNSIKVTGDIGMSSAAGFYQSICGLTLVLFTNWIVRKVDVENSLF